MGVEAWPVPQVRRARAEGRVGEPSSGGVLVVDRPDGALGQAVLQVTRLRLLALLSSEVAHARGGYSLHDLGELLGCSSQNVHHHLRVLVDTGTVYMVPGGAPHVGRQHWCSDVQSVRVHVAAKAIETVLDLHLVVEPTWTETESRLLALGGAEASGLHTLVHAGVVRALERLPPDERAVLAGLLSRNGPDEGGEHHPE